jgi:hypothetical protein
MMTWLFSFDMLKVNNSENKTFYKTVAAPPITKISTRIKTPLTHNCLPATNQQQIRIIKRETSGTA